jgi:hypothetical protein
MMKFPKQGIQNVLQFNIFGIFNYRMNAYLYMFKSGFFTYG